MTTLIFTSSATPDVASLGPPVVATSTAPTAQITLLTTAASTASVAPTRPFVQVGTNNYCPNSHSLAEAAGVGISVGVFAASIVILTFVLIRRHQTRARKISPTIAPDVLVSGPMAHTDRGWEEYVEKSNNFVPGGGTLKRKEPPMYTKSV
ncbi:hypothetical protein N431DRAFT_450662 [Stipitochalara longipes BDJ]|nr:hypothetical protein N431DRAFT_450662 [Stipitochalara longipes BDJ]